MTNRKLDNRIACWLFPSNSTSILSFTFLNKRSTCTVQKTSNRLNSCYCHRILWNIKSFHLWGICRNTYVNLLTWINSYVRFSNKKLGTIVFWSWNTSAHFRFFCTSRCNRSALRRFTSTCWCSCRCNLSFWKTIYWRDSSNTLSICYGFADHNSVIIVEFYCRTRFCFNSHISWRTCFPIKVWSDLWCLACWLIRISRFIWRSN